MIEKFINNQLSEKEVDSLMENFFEQKEEIKFKKRWKTIIDENENQPKVFSIYRSRFYKIAAVASIAVFIGVYTNFPNNSIIKSNDKISYSTSIKGNGDAVINKIIDKYDVTNIKNEYSLSLVLIEKYEVKKYNEVIKIMESSNEQDSSKNNEDIWIAAISAIKINNINKAKFFLNRLKKDKKFGEDSRLLIKLLK